MSFDAEMVQRDVITLADEFEKIKEESGKNTLFVVCPSGYSIPYGNMVLELTLYSRLLEISSSSTLNNEEHNGDAELMGENPDIPYIMSTCCAKGMDYVIVSRNQSMENAFTENGYKPAITSNSFLVYACYGYKGYVQDNTNRGQTSYISYYDENGNPDIHSTGYSTVRFIYDDRGNMIEKHYLNKDNDLCIISFGYAGVKYEYNNQRKCIKETYLNQAGKAINLYAGYSSIIRTYTTTGLLESQKYEDVDGRLVLFQGRIETRYEYDANGHLVLESYYDENGNPMDRIDLMYFKKAILYDEHGNENGEQYYSISGEQTCSTLGYASYMRELSMNDQIVSEEYFDEKGSKLGGIYEGKINNEGNVFLFPHCSSNITVKGDRYFFSTTLQQNHFNLVHFQLYDAKTGGHIISFGETSKVGETEGIYTCNVPNGLYWLVLKANSNLADESVSCLVYIEERTMVEYSFVIDSFSDKYIELSDVQVMLRMDSQE